MSADVGDGAMVLEAHECNNPTGFVAQYIASAMLSTLHLFLRNRELDTMSTKKIWNGLGLGKWRWEIWKLYWIFQDGLEGYSGGASDMYTRCRGWHGRNDESCKHVISELEHCGESTTGDTILVMLQEGCFSGATTELKEFMKMKFLVYHLGILTGKI